MEEKEWVESEIDSDYYKLPFTELYSPINLFVRYRTVIAKEEEEEEDDWWDDAKNWNTENLILTNRIKT